MKKSHIIKLIALLLGFVLLACSQPADQSAEQLADFVYTGGKIYTVNENQPWAEAVAVKGNKIVYVGDNAGAAAFVGKDTKQTVLAGRMMLPGFVEGHFHATMPGILLRGVDLQSESMDELLGKLKEYVEKNPDLKQIHGWGEPLIPEPGPIDVGAISPVRSFQTFSPSFDEVFDWLWSNFSSLTRPKSGRIQNVTFEVPLTREQAFRGGTARVMVPAKSVCPTCRGYGGIGPYECSRCAGEGDISGEMPVSISFPPGLTKNHAVMIPLDRFGIRNLHMTVLFRPTDANKS